MKRKGFRTLFTSIIALLLLLSTIPLAGCFGTGAEEPTPAPAAAKEITELKSRVATLEKVVTNLKGQAAGVVSQADVDALSTQIATLQSELDTAKSKMVIQTGDMEDLVSIVADLEDEIDNLTGEQAVSEDWEPVKWYLDVAITDAYPPIPAGYEIDIKVVGKDPSIIREDGEYEIEVIIINNNTTPGEDWDMRELELELILRPREYSPINQSKTDLDSEKAPWLDWDKRFVMRSTGNLCKRIVFTSDWYNFKHILEVGKYYRLDLVLELYYD